MLQCVAVCCSVLQCVAVCCSVLLDVVCRSELQSFPVCCSVWQYVLQCVADLDDNDVLLVDKVLLWSGYD